MTTDILACPAPWTLEPLELDVDELLYHAAYGDSADRMAAAEELARRCGRIDGPVSFSCWLY